MKKIKLFEEFVSEVSKQMISGTSGRTITTLDNRKYELKKDVKDAKIGDYINVVLPKGTIITNLPGGVFANHKDLKDKYCTGYKSERWDEKFGVGIRTMPDTLEAIEDNSKVLESIDIEEILNELHLSSAGVKDFLRAVYNSNTNIIQKLNFKNFRGLTDYIKGSDIEEFDELRDEAAAAGLVLLESIVIEAIELVHVYDTKGKLQGTGELVKTKGNKSLIRWDGSSEEWIDSKLVKLVESAITPKMANNFKIGNKIKTQKGTYTITGFGSKTGATRDFEAENENGDKFNLRVSLRGATGIQVAAGKSLNFPEQEEMLESRINEDAATTFLILMQSAMVMGQLALLGNKISAGGGTTPIEDLKNWWQKRKSDKAVKSIIDKIKDDEDIVEFMKLTPSQQRGKFRSLVATKLNDEELNYLNKINRNHFQTESLDENFPGPGETVDAKDLDYDMLDYFSRTNKVLSIDTKSKKGIKGSVGKMYNDLVFNGDSIAKKDIVRVKILEGTYNNDREIAIYDGEDGLTYIEKRGKGYYGYNDEFDFEAENKAELEKKLKSWKYKLMSGSIDEAFVGPFFFSNSTSDEDLKKMYDDALSGYANWLKGFEYPKADYKKAYQEIEKLLKKRGIKVDESIVNEHSLQESKYLNEAKILSRVEMKNVMVTKYGLSFVKNSEEFDGEEGGIWLGGNDGLLMPNAKDEMFNYYHGGSKFPQGIHKDLAKFLDKCGWYGQFADPGTVMLWPR